MVIIQGDTFGVPTDSTVLLIVRDVSDGYDRVFYFKNNDANTLAIIIEHSSDGGANWTTAVGSFNLTSGSQITKTVAAANSGILRITASGGSWDGSSVRSSLFIQLHKFKTSVVQTVDTPQTWMSPVG